MDERNSPVCLLEAEIRASPHHHFFFFFFLSIKHFTLYLYLLRYVACIQMNTPCGTAETSGEILGSDFVSSGEVARLE